MTEEKPDPSRGRQARRPPRKRRRKASEKGQREDSESDDGSADEQDIEDELLGDATNADDDDPTRLRGSAGVVGQHIPHRSTQVQKPDSGVRIKSAVYVLDND
ncbi:hypothetical protein C8Q74DRAFT_1369260 [Fomes fomentarius]|nr:hypothetical protein C8Q74DRAFT_1369260 [Fomes fomentarius]